MSESELAIAGLYDHEQESGRRAPDWGGDEVFAAPAPRRRRFEHGGPLGHGQGRLRDDAHEHITAVHDHTGPQEPAEPAPEPYAEPASDPYAEPAPAGRRTVTITGRPESFAAPRRPSRTFDERIAHRPERIASWTCALGAMSILLAIVTAQ